MKPAQSRDDLLVELARAGEPLAFCTVFSDAMSKTYQSLIDSGNSAEETARLFTFFARKTYRSFIQHQSKQSALDWYTDQEKQHLSKFIKDKDIEGEVAVESLVQENGRFGRQLSLLIQREYGRLHRAERELSIINRVVHGLMKKPILVGLLLVLLIVSIGVPIIYYWCLKTGTKLIINAESGNRHWMVSVPFANQIYNPISPSLDSPIDSLHNDISKVTVKQSPDLAHSDALLPKPMKAIPKPLSPPESGKPYSTSTSTSSSIPSKIASLSGASSQAKEAGVTSNHPIIRQRDSLNGITATAQTLSSMPLNSSTPGTRSTMMNSSTPQASSNSINSVVDTVVQLR